MRCVQALLLSLLLPFSRADSLVGVYIFSRHGDRTAKATPPVNLTGLGYKEVFDSGTYFRNRYINSTFNIAGISTDVVKLSEITASAPSDNVLRASAQGFLQGLYPPAGLTNPGLDTEVLSDGTVVKIPMNAYQLIPLQTVTAGAGSEDATWLQGQSGCAKAQYSSNAYYASPEYQSTLANTAAFYKTLAPLVKNALSDDQISYKNAYTIWDLINVARTHNATFDPNHILTDDIFFQARQLADLHEWNLAYNASDPIRAIAGATLAGEILEALDTTITNAGKTKISIQFGAYANFQSFFGLAQLPTTSPDFYGVPDYTSSMTFELFTNGEANPFPKPEDLNVRFLFHNGTTEPNSEPSVFPLFGQKETTLPYKTFADRMRAFAISDQTSWCQACGNTTGVCAGSGPAPASSTSTSAKGTSGLSKTVVGVIGAMVTLAVILGLAVLVMSVGGMRLVRKKNLMMDAASTPPSNGSMSKSEV